MHLADFIAGSVGGAFGVVVGYPLDTVKVKLQTQAGYTGVWQCVRRTCRNEGLQGFYRGMSMPLSTISISSSVVFGTYRNVLNLLQRTQHMHNTHKPRKAHIFLSGFAGGVAQVLVISPADIVKVRLQCQTEQAHRSRYRGALQCLRSIVRNEGLLGLYKGSLALALRDGPSEHRRFKGVFHCLTHSVRSEGIFVLYRGLTLNCIRAFPVNMCVFAAYELMLRLLHPETH
ncbi:hypothetical protein DNTS_016279 [Danionella cerebrum]|uniref:Solute carrier family 25 member 47 n=1 Tax=Danionella cerebrum TaxID=2873325 RepID=A0A553Q0W6_9TELE|nr:hypothetical protein DNTS_016279 [Danionella translucida]